MRARLPAGRGAVKGKLFVLATPLGNLGDLSPRAAEVLRQVDVVAGDKPVPCYQSRVTDLGAPVAQWIEHRTTNP